MIITIFTTSQSFQIMKENKFGALLTAFRPEDWSTYHKFSKSRYGEDTDHQKVMDYIKKHKSRYDPKKMDTEYLRSKVRPNTKPIVFSNVISQLCKHIEAYFIWAEVMDDPMMEDTLLLQAFAKRGLTEQFHKKKKKSAEKRVKMPLGLWKYYHEFMVEYLEYYKRMTTSISESKVVLENCSKYLENFSDSINGYLGVEMHNREKVLREIWDSKFKHLSINNESSIKDLSTLFFFYKKLKEKRDWDSYYLLKKELFKANLSTELEFTTITYMGSFLKWKNLNNEEKASQELVDIYTYGLRNNIMFPNRIIPLNSYATIIQVGSNTGNHVWAESFINNYSHLVSDKKTDQIKTYGYAHLAFTKGNFEETINLLRSKKIKDFHLELKIKWLLLSSQYELNTNDIESFKYYIDAFKSYINRNKEKSTVDVDKAYLNSINFFNKMIYKSNLEELEKAIKLENKMIGKKWFLEKLKELRT